MSKKNSLGNKVSLLRYLFVKVFFADDRDDNVMSVLRICPEVIVYRISPLLVKKLERRRK